MTTPDPAETKKARVRHKVTRYSTPWLALVPLIWWEIKMIREGRMGGPLSHVIWWAYGDQFTFRWWVLSCAMTGFLGWAAWHFAMQTPGVRELLTLLGVGVFVGVTGWLITR